MYKEDIRLIRGVMGMTADQLGAALGYSGAYIRRLESGTVDVPLTAARKYAELLLSRGFHDNLSRAIFLAETAADFLKKS